MYFGRIFPKAIQLIDSWILNLMGWQELSAETKRLMTAHKRMVVVGPHTTRWDFFFFLMFKFRDPEYFARIKIIVKPQIYNLLCFLFGDRHFLPAPRREDRGSNGVERIVHALREEDDFILIIYPEGTMSRAEWRSGYFAIAKSIPETVIGVCGADYEQKRCVVSQEVWIPSEWDVDEREGASSINFQRLQSEIQDCSAQIVPLYPEHSCVNVKRPYNEADVGCVDWVFLTSLGCWFPACYVICKYKGSPWEILITMVSASLSVLYHRGKETNREIQRIDSFCAWTAVCTHLVRTVYFSPFLLSPWYEGVQIMSWLATLGFYKAALKSCPSGSRDVSCPRNRGYVNFHSLYHVFGLVSFLLPFAAIRYLGPSKFSKLPL
jgi:hypothetical protein